MSKNVFVQAVEYVESFFDESAVGATAAARNRWIAVGAGLGMAALAFSWLRRTEPVRALFLLSSFLLMRACLPFRSAGTQQAPPRTASSV